MARKFVIDCDKCGRMEPLEVEPRDETMHDWANNVVGQELEDIKFRPMYFCETCYPEVQKILRQNKGEEL
jgi:hypothetical protein